MSHWLRYKRRRRLKTYRKLQVATVNSDCKRRAEHSLNLFLHSVSVIPWRPTTLGAFGRSTPYKPFPPTVPNLIALSQTVQPCKRTKLKTNWRLFCILHTLRGTILKYFHCNFVEWRSNLIIFAKRISKWISLHLHISQYLQNQPPSLFYN